MIHVFRSSFPAIQPGLLHSSLPATHSLESTSLPHIPKPTPTCLGVLYILSSSMDKKDHVGEIELQSRSTDDLKSKKSLEPPQLEDPTPDKPLPETPKDPTVTATTATATLSPSDDAQYLYGAKLWSLVTALSFPVFLITLNASVVSTVSRLSCITFSPISRSNQQWTCRLSLKSQASSTV